MSSDKAGSFRLAMPSVTSSFKYRVVAGAVTSPTYDVSVALPPRVTRIDVDYTYPAALRLEPRTEADGGDIYAPAGTDVRVHVFTDRPAATGQMALGNGKPIALAAAKPNEFTATLQGDRRQLVPRRAGRSRGFASPGDTEYFIRTLEDRPPEVRVLKPATDRSVTRLEEVDIEAQAEDDYGIDRLDLVYSVRGEAEKVVPLVDRDAERDGQRPAHAVSRGSRRAAGRLRLLLRPRARPHARHAAERGAQRHLLPRSEAVRAGVRARAEPGRHARRRPGTRSTTSSRRRRRSSSPPGSSIGAARSANGAKSEQDIRSVVEGGSGAEDARRADRRARSASRRCAIRAGGSRSAAADRSRRRRPRPS